MAFVQFSIILGLAALQQTEWALKKVQTGSWGLAHPDCLLLLSSFKNKRLRKKNLMDVFEQS